jgi:hypothetical protein
MALFIRQLQNGARPRDRRISIPSFRTLTNRMGQVVTGSCDAQTSLCGPTASSSPNFDKSPTLSHSELRKGFGINRITQEAGLAHCMQS